MHGSLRGGIPRSRRLALHVVLADERCLNLPGASRVNCGLAAPLRSLLAAGALRGRMRAGAMLLGCRRGSMRRFLWRSQRIRDGEPMHGQAEQAAEPDPLPTPNLISPVHLITVETGQAPSLHKANCGPIKNRRDRANPMVPETGTERQSRRSAY